jgi:uncharacterized protein (TIGR03066 family)
MRAVVASVAVAVLVGFAGFVGAADEKKDEKVDVKKLLGKWEPAKPEKDAPVMILEMQDKGKFTLHVTFMGKTEKVDGTYKVDGNKIEVEMTFNGKTEKDTLTVVKLTDTEMVTKGKNGKEEALKKLKDK